MTYPPSARSLLQDNHPKPIEETDRFSFVTDEGKVSLIISPGVSPYPWDDEAFRLVCVGFNQFTAEAAYINFIAPNTTLTDY
jgi:hypothetical protein